MTAFGAAAVFIILNANRKFLDASLGFAAGVMIAASFWSLLAPSIELSASYGFLNWLPATIGFLAGGTFLYLIDGIIPHLHLGCPVEDAEGLKIGWDKNWLLLLAIVIHNIPEGLAVGVAFGAVASTGNIAAPFSLALGIGIQNLPEGAAVSLPFYGGGLSKWKSFFYGQLSGIIEIFAGGTRSLDGNSLHWHATICSGICSRCNDIRSHRRSYPRMSKRR